MPKQSCFSFIFEYYRHGNCFFLFCFLAPIGVQRFTVSRANGSAAREGVCVCLCKGGGTPALQQYIGILWVKGNTNTCFLSIFLISVSRKDRRKKKKELSSHPTAVSGIDGCNWAEATLTFTLSLRLVFMLSCPRSDCEKAEPEMGGIHGGRGVLTSPLVPRCPPSRSRRSAAQQLTRSSPKHTPYFKKEMETK